MSYNDYDPADWTYYNPDYPDDEFDDDYNDLKQSTNEEQKDSYNKTNTDSKKKKPKVKNAESLKLVTKKIASCKNNKQIRSNVIRILLNMNIEDSISNYVKREYLPEKYANLAKERNCLETLIKSFLKENLDYSLTSDIINEINYLIDEIYKNIELDIVYTRVKKIQKFIHEKADLKFGNNASLKLPPEVMRKLLSTSRLHLNILDSKELEIESLISIITKSKNEHLKYDDIKYTFSGKKTKRNYAKDFNTLITIDDTLILNINKINDLDLNKPLVVFRKEILSIFESSFYMSNNSFVARARAIFLAP